MGVTRSLPGEQHGCSEEKFPMTSCQHVAHDLSCHTSSSARGRGTFGKGRAVPWLRLSSHLARTWRASGRPRRPAGGARSRRSSTQISRRRCRTAVLSAAGPLRTAASPSWTPSAPAEAVCWRGFRSSPGLVGAGGRRPPASLSCALPLGSRRTQCFLKRSPVQKERTRSETPFGID